jgi:hypothetical protein
MAVALPPRCKPGQITHQSIQTRTSPGSGVALGFVGCVDLRFSANALAISALIVQALQLELSHAGPR